MELKMAYNLSLLIQIQLHNLKKLKWEIYSTQ